ncbi:MAG: CRISPR-associated endonuclease Cas2 [Thermomicrobiales bacterium]
MEVLITYDVSTETREGRRRLRRVAETCVGFGQRVQYSVFECSLTPVQFEAMLHRLLAIIDQDEDSLRVYRLREPRERYLSIYGTRPEVNFRDPLIV